ncbi:MAG: T9SS type A sorting domain-containing protein, partial [Chitinivibrionia bacterium]|nr:T9SS type A sorting domain-containing protein [Chitinivibrionia bacterium]
GDSAATIPWSVFFIAAHTTTPSVYFDSAPDSGYSVDNAIPCAPEHFTVAYNTGSGNYLEWEPCLNENFDHYRIYRGSSPDFPLIPENIVFVTTDTQWSDPEYDGWDVHYKITSVTTKGLESDPASPETVTSAQVSSVPDHFRLHQNVPNPFNPSTSIQYDVPAGGGFVTLHVYDIRGLLVRRLVEGEQSPGATRVFWNGRNDDGRRCASGVYFYRLTAPGFTETRKMVMLQ